MAGSDKRLGGSRAFAWGVTAFLIVAAVAGYLLGEGKAADRAEAASVRGESFREAFSPSFAVARKRSLTRGERSGLIAGARRGERAGSKAGAEEGGEAAEAELGRIEAEREAAEAAAAEAAELAIPAPCRGLPDSTARRMCIGAVEAGTYP